MLPLCLSEGIGVIPWSPLARGRLTRPWGEETLRAGTDPLGETLYGESEAQSKAIVDALNGLATRRGVPPARLALAWVLSRPAVTAPIVGVTKLPQLDDAVAALDVELTADEIAALEAPYRPRRPTELG